MNGIDCETASLPWSTSPGHRRQQGKLKVRARCGFALHRGARAWMAGVVSPVELGRVRGHLLTVNLTTLPRPDLRSEYWAADAPLGLGAGSMHR
jgi:hypothetical protein